MKPKDYFLEALACLATIVFGILAVGAAILISNYAQGVQ